jgi:hypothetical protein
MENVLGPDHYDTLMIVAILALVLQSRGKYDVAEALLRQALEGMENALGPEHPQSSLLAS